jgi:hypothetical protein
MLKMKKERQKFRLKNQYSAINLKFSNNICFKLLIDKSNN